MIAKQNRTSARDSDQSVPKAIDVATATTCELTGDANTPSTRRRYGMKLLDQGNSVSQVATALEVDSRTVRRWRHRDSADRVGRSQTLVAGRPRLTQEQWAHLFETVGVKQPTTVGLYGKYGCFWTTDCIRRYVLREFPKAAEGYMCDQSLRKVLKENGCVWGRHQLWKRNVK